ncbi:MAG: c-type cytochrome [Gammaproteobacteria bacterium]|nr:c-type cytochrome [Gammaproteobacteria bacterium]
MHKKLQIIISIIAISFSISIFANESVKPSLETGAKIFKSRCVLCHGGVGMGEGMLSMAVKDYPNTNLLDYIKAKLKDDIRDYVIWGGPKNTSSEFSPPWGNELTWTEIESVTDFIVMLRTDTENAIKLIEQQQVVSKPSLKIGQKIYQSRCMKCHGKTGEGDGKMSKIIKNPPPFNFTKSIMPDEYLRMMISLGGEAMNRSPKMPPFGDELKSIELESVIMHIKSYRTK